MRFFRNGRLRIGKLITEQECIPVGCGPPACCPYLAACTTWGVPGPGGAPTWSQGGCVPSWSWGLYLPGPGGVPAWSWGWGVPAWFISVKCQSPPVHSDQATLLVDGNDKV